MSVWATQSTSAVRWVPSAARSDGATLFRRQLAVAAATVLLIPLNWLLGTTLLWVYAAAALLLVRPQRLSALEWIFIAMCAMLTLSIVIGLNQISDGERIVASLYNISVIVIFIAFANAARKIQSPGSSADCGPSPIYRAAFWCFAVQITFILALSVYVRGSSPRDIPFSTLLLGAFGELPGILSQYSQSFLSIIDWQATGPEYRVYGFGIYANEGAILIVLVGLLAATHSYRQRRFVTLLGIEALTGLALFLMGSRTTFLAYLLSLGLMVALGGRRIVRLALLCIPLIAVLSVIGMTYGPRFVGTALHHASDSRAGSSNERFKTYNRAIETVQETNLLTGLGIKPRDDSFAAIPIGSHSSFISMLTRSGLIGLALWTVFSLLLIAQVICSQWLLYGDDPRIHPARRAELAYLSRCILVLLMWWTTEDFDAPVHQAAVAALCLGLFWNLLPKAIETASPARRWR